MEGFDVAQARGDRILLNPATNTTSKNTTSHLASFLVTDGDPDPQQVVHAAVAEP